MFNLFKRRTASDAARELAKIGASKRNADRKAKVRAQVDAMRSQMGLPEWEWK